MTRIKQMFKTPFITVSACLLAIFSFATAVQAQEPKPGPARSVSVPNVKESKLKNGLTVAVVEKRNIPIVTVQLLVRSGASSEGAEKAGLADMTASMLTKGTKTRTAEQIAQEIEFLGGSIFSGASWNNSSITVSVTSDKLDQAMAIFADVALNPSFPQSELDLLKSQAIDGLTYNLTQPGFISNYVASQYSFREHPVGGTIDSLRARSADQVKQFYEMWVIPQKSILIFSGDVSETGAKELASKYFAGWSYSGPVVSQGSGCAIAKGTDPTELARRILVVDLPDSGQASVSYIKKSCESGRGRDVYYPASVLNSLVGGGYSSRLNQEIRIKRGLSYGAGSSFAWRENKANFGTRTQTKNESAPEVAELVLAEIKRLTEGSIAAAELDPRKSVLTGGFGRNIETTAGLVNAVADLYTFNIPTAELNNYMRKVNAVTDKQIREFAAANLLGGDIIIVGDYAKFKDDLAKRFPATKPTVIPAAELDVPKPGLR